MSTTEKGDRLENALYTYLCEQQENGSYVYDVYSPKLCKIYKKKKYYCKERKRDIEFDVVIELFREGRDQPHLYVVFECKNHARAIAERDITDFSDKIGRLFQHAVKGVVVFSSSLQSGAENVANSRRMGIVKFDEHGWEVVADRKGCLCVEVVFVRSQIIRTERYTKSLKFAAYCDGRFFGSIDQFLASLDAIESSSAETGADENSLAVPYISSEEIERTSAELLQRSGYQVGPTDLAEICSTLSIELIRTEQVVYDEDGRNILGSANFDRKTISINAHGNSMRERFTIGHEIGHFYLRHNQFIRSETIVEQDLFSEENVGRPLNFERLEYQANAFASALLLPAKTFFGKVSDCRLSWNIVDKGHGYVFVDDQPCNFARYNQFISELSTYFDVSVQAIEIRLRKRGLLTDQRRTFKGP